MIKKIINGNVNFEKTIDFISEDQIFIDDYMNDEVYIEIENNELFYEAIFNYIKSDIIENPHKKNFGNMDRANFFKFLLKNDKFEELFNIGLKKEKIIQEISGFFEYANLPIKEEEKLITVLENNIELLSERIQEKVISAKFNIFVKNINLIFNYNEKTTKDIMNNEADVEIEKAYYVYLENKQNLLDKKENKSIISDRLEKTKDILENITDMIESFEGYFFKEEKETFNELFRLMLNHENYVNGEIKLDYNIISEILDFKKILNSNDREKLLNKIMPSYISNYNNFTFDAFHEHLNYNFSENVDFIFSSIASCDNGKDYIIEEFLLINKENFELVVDNIIKYKIPFVSLVDNFTKEFQDEIYVDFLELYISKLINNTNSKNYEETIDIIVELIIESKEGKNKSSFIKIKNEDILKLQNIDPNCIFENDEILEIITDYDLIISELTSKKLSSEVKELYFNVFDYDLYDKFNTTKETEKLKKFKENIYLLKSKEYSKSDNIKDDEKIYFISDKLNGRNPLNLKTVNKVFEKVKGNVNHYDIHMNVSDFNKVFSLIKTEEDFENTFKGIMDISLYSFTNENLKELDNILESKSIEIKKLFSSYLQYNMDYINEIRILMLMNINDYMDSGDKKDLKSIEDNLKLLNNIDLKKRKKFFNEGFYSSIEHLEIFKYKLFREEDETDEKIKEVFNLFFDSDFILNTQKEYSLLRKYNEENTQEILLNIYKNSTDEDKLKIITEAAMFKYGGSPFKNDFEELFLNNIDFFFQDFERLKDIDYIDFRFLDNNINLESLGNSFNLDNLDYIYVCSLRDPRSVTDFSRQSKKFSEILAHLIVKNDKFIIKEEYLNLENIFSIIYYLSKFKDKDIVNTISQENKNILSKLLKEYLIIEDQENFSYSSKFTNLKEAVDLGLITINEISEIMNNWRDSFTQNVFMGQGTLHFIKSEIAYDSLKNILFSNVELEDEDNRIIISNNHSPDSEFMGKVRTFVNKRNNIEIDDDMGTATWDTIYYKKHNLSQQIIKENNVMIGLDSNRYVYSTLSISDTKIDPKNHSSSAPIIKPDNKSTVKLEKAALNLFLSKEEIKLNNIFLTTNFLTIPENKVKISLKDRVLNKINLFIESLSFLKNTEEDTENLKSLYIGQEIFTKTELLYLKDNNITLDLGDYTFDLNDLKVEKLTKSKLKSLEMIEELYVEDKDENYYQGTEFKEIKIQLFDVEDMLKNLKHQVKKVQKLDIKTKEEKLEDFIYKSIKTGVIEKYIQLNKNENIEDFERVLIKAKETFLNEILEMNEYEFLELIDPDSREVLNIYLKDEDSLNLIFQKFNNINSQEHINDSSRYRNTKRLMEKLNVLNKFRNDIPLNEIIDTYSYLNLENIDKINLFKNIDLLKLTHSMIEEQKLEFIKFIKLTAKTPEIEKFILNGIGEYGIENEHYKSIVNKIFNEIRNDENGFNIYNFNIKDLLKEVKNEVDIDKKNILLNNLNKLLFYTEEKYSVLSTDNIFNQVKHLDNFFKIDVDDISFILEEFLSDDYSNVEKNFFNFYNLKINDEISENMRNYPNLIEKVVSALELLNNKLIDEKRYEEQDKIYKILRPKTKELNFDNLKLTLKQMKIGMEERIVGYTEELLKEEEEETTVYFNNEFIKTSFIDYINFDYESMFEEGNFLKIMDKDEKLEEIFIQTITSDIEFKYGEDKYKKMEELNIYIKEYLVVKLKYDKLLSDYNKTKSVNKKEKIQLEIEELDIDERLLEIKGMEEELETVFDKWNKNINIKLSIFENALISKLIPIIKDKYKDIKELSFVEHFDNELYEKQMEIYNKKTNAITQKDYNFLATISDNKHFMYSMFFKDDTKNNKLLSLLFNKDNDNEKQFEILSNFNVKKYFKISRYISQNLVYEDDNQEELDLIQEIMFYSNYDMNKLQPLVNMCNNSGFDFNAIHLFNMSSMQLVEINEFINYFEKMEKYASNKFENYDELSTFMQSAIGNIDYVLKEHGDLKGLPENISDIIEAKGFDLKGSMGGDYSYSLKCASLNKANVTSISDSSEDNLNEISDNIEEYKERESEKINKFFFLKKLYKDEETGKWSMIEFIPPTDTRTYVQGYAANSCLKPGGGFANDILDEMSIKQNKWGTFLENREFPLDGDRERTEKEEIIFNDIMEGLEEKISIYNDKIIETGEIDEELYEELKDITKKYFAIHAAGVTFGIENQGTIDNVELNEKTFITGKNGEQIRVNKMSDKTIEGLKDFSKNSILHSKLQILLNIEKNINKHTKENSNGGIYLDEDSVKSEYSKLKLPLYFTVGSGYTETSLLKEFDNSKSLQKNFLVNDSGVYTDAEREQQYLISSDKNFRIGNNQSIIKYFDNIIYSSNPMKSVKKEINNIKEEMRNNLNILENNIDNNKIISKDLN